MDDLKTINRVFTIWSDELEGRLDPKFYSPITLAWNEEWKIEKLGKFLERRLEIFPADELSEENFATLSLTGEVKPKRIMGWRRAKGALFSSKFFRAKEGDFVFSKIDIRNGASAVIPKGREIAVTAEFPVYSVSSEILPEYLALLFRYKQVLSWLDRKSIGHSGRKRTDGKVIEALPIPIPPIGIQKEMVERLNNAIQEKKRKEQEIRDILSSIDTFVLGELGVEVPEGGAEEKIFTVWSDEIEKRFDPIFLQRFSFFKKIKSKYPLVSIGEVMFQSPQYGANEVAIEGDRTKDTRYIRITDINDFGDLREEGWKTAKRKDEKYLLADEDLLIARSGATAGKSFLYKSELGRAIFAGYLIRFRFDKSKVIPEYLFFITKTRFYELWKNLIQRSAAQPNINSEEFKAFEFPLPPIDVQEMIIENARKVLQKAKDLKADTNRIISEAQKQSEQVLFTKA